MKTVRLIIDPQRLTQSALQALDELEKKGFIQNGVIAYEEENEEEVFELLNKIERHKLG
ncbi:hypothetical protein HPS57_01260 [Prevotella sp. PINT]|jgi:hypothetical protein|uniref:hypothetical protein n=1 Tax=Palleniella intestinalis TaxID=2736291 RepID=UPI001552697C|nr:hypothetical protein [Palleniella intestinalis]NPD80614.1 hypothetical protein [Palleniella intestinalis]